CPAIFVEQQPAGTRMTFGVKVWDAATGREVLSLHGHAQQVVRAVFTPDGKRLLALVADGSLKAWDTDIGREAPAPRLQGPAHPVALPAVAFRPGARRAAVARPGGPVKVWDTATGAAVFALKVFPRPEGGINRRVTGLAFSPDGTRLACGTGSALFGVGGAVEIWDVAGGGRGGSLAGGGGERVGLA